MKKLFFFAAAALTLAACTSEELNVQNTKEAILDNTAVNFDVYTMRGVTRAGTPNDIDNTNIGEIGFGVFAYYTNSKQYDKSATPNFMYNQKVVADGEAGATGTKWTYEPVKYWPNEFGDAAKADEVDYLTFFAYAPWTKLVPTTGKPDMKDVDDDAKDNWQNKNILEAKANDVNGDPIIKYRVDTDPATSVDLLWGVNADENGWKPIDAENTDAQNLAGLPFIDLIKPAVPTDADGGKIKFNLRHALAKVRITIDYIADAQTPVGPSEEIDDTQTRIFVRWIEMSGFAMEGALNLNNTEPNIPLWKDLDGERDLKFENIVFNDGRKDGKEGTENGTAKEANAVLNPEIVENFCLLNAGKFGDDKNPGVKMFANDNYATAQLLFGGDPGENGGYFYVIPRNQEEGVNVKINYGVLTIDPNLAGTLSGTKDNGSEIENQIYKEDIFGDGIDFEAGKQYDIHIHLGMTSVKIEAIVEPWDDTTDPADVDLPDNQPEGTAEPASTGEHANDIAVGTVFKFSSDWDTEASARIAAIDGDIVKVIVTGSQADGTYYVNLDEFGDAITPATDTAPRKLNSAFTAPVYETKAAAEAKTPYLFKVTISPNV